MVKKLCIVSHVIHYVNNDKLYAYGPYAREIDIWADIFPEITIAAPCRNEVPPKFCMPFNKSNIHISPQIESGGERLKDKFLQSALLPKHLWNLSKAMKEADAIHVRCPGNLGLFGVLLAPLYSKNLVAKYAGQWDDYEGEPVTYRWQKKILKSLWWNSPVTVYGEWENQPSHIIPFFTSMMTKEQVNRAVAAAEKKKIHNPLRIIFSGRLSKEKGVSNLIEALNLSLDKGLNAELKIIGNGPEFENLRHLVKKLKIEDKVFFTGDLPYEAALKWYEWGDCLVLPSKTEGFPKVIAEAMCYGLICIGVRLGQIPAILEGRGIIIDEVSSEKIFHALMQLSENSDYYSHIGLQASLWSRQFTLDKLKIELAKLLSEHWSLQLNTLTRLSD